MAADKNKKVEYYTASSVIAALKKNTNCTCEGLENVKCPKDECKILPEECPLAKKHECFQTVKVIDKENRVTLLRFTFPVSSANNDGYISQKNSTLQWLLKKYLIDGSSLKEL